MTADRATAAPRVLDMRKARAAGRQLLAANDPKPAAPPVTFAELQDYVNEKVRAIVSAPLGSAP